MSSSVTLNGISEMETRSPSSLLDDEESFVVLNSCVDEVTDQLTSLLCSSENSSNVAISQPASKNSVENVANVASVMISSHGSSFSGTFELSAEEIQQKMESLIRENSELKDTLKINTTAIMQQYEVLAKWQEDVVRVQESHKIKFEETKKLVINLKAENAELRKLANSSNDSSNEHLNLKSKISALEFELDTLRQANAKASMEQAKIIQELELKLSESEKMRFEVCSKNKTQIESLASQLKQVEEEYNKVQQELEETKKKLPTDIDIANRETLKEQLKELAQEVILKTTMLREKTELTDSLHETISKLKIENECIPILKTQVEVYQSDFNQEREERAKLKTEKDTLAEDLKNLQRRNQKLLEQIEMLQSNQYGSGGAESSGSASARSSSNRNTPSREEQTVYDCPKCFFAFYNYQALENHVYRCLESTD